MSARIASFVNCAVTKANFAVSKAVYYGKVGAELTKTVYLKEGFQPPNFSDFELVYWRLKRQALQLKAEPKKILSLLQSATKNDMIRYGCYGVQFAGLYSLGEVIGRRHLFGYKNYNPESAHH